MPLDVRVLQFAFDRMPTTTGRLPPEVQPPAPRPAARRLDGTFRAHERTKVALRALVTHVEKGWQRHLPVEDIGLGGARIVVEDPIRPGDAVTVSFTAPSLWDPLVLRARVVWASPASSAPRGTSNPSRAEPRHAGIAFDHRGAPSAFALFELISTVGYE